jgi:pimeloyl-ACP methyl ester carboxylesterase
MNYFDKAKVTPALVQRWTDFNNRHQGAPRVLPPGGKPFFSGTPADLAAIRTPTLLLWSDHDPETPVETHGQEALGLLAAKDKSLVVIPRCGHMMPEECGPESLVPARAFLDRVVR